MKIIDELLSNLDYETSVRDIRQGAFQTAVVIRNCGLASTPHDPGPHHNNIAVNKAGLLLSIDAAELAHMSLSTSLLEAAIGMAAINSLIDVDDRKCQELNASDLLLSKGTGKKVAIVGHFPFIPKLREVAEELWVIERNPKEGDFTEAEAEHLISRASVVGITGTAFTNHTIEHLLGFCNPDAYVVILGGTAPLSPVLFDYGVNAISGTRVTDPDTVLNYLSQGSTFRQLRGIRLLTMTKGQE